MKFLIDANLSPRVARRLSAAAHEAVHVNDVGLGTADDDVILQRATDAGEVIVSADADFVALLALRRQASPSVVLLRSSDHLPPDEQSDIRQRGLSSVADGGHELRDLTGSLLEVLAGTAARRLRRASPCRGA